MSYKPLPKEVTIKRSKVEGLGLFSTRTIEKDTEIVLQGYNSSLTMLDSRGSNGNSNLVSENKSALPNDNLNQENSDLDDEIPF